MSASHFCRLVQFRSFLGPKLTRLTHLLRFACSFQTIIFAFTILRPFFGLDKPLFTFPQALRGDPAHLSACLPHTQTARHSLHCRTEHNIKLSMRAHNIAQAVVLCHTHLALSFALPTRQSLQRYNQQWKRSSSSATNFWRSVWQHWASSNRRMFMHLHKDA